MVGDGSLRGELQLQAKRLNIEHRVHFVGFQDDPRPYLALMDVFVLPVPFGSMSIGLLEAMAMSLPVVMTFGGEGEAVEHGVSGYCAEPNDPSSIARYLTELLEDADRRRAMGRAARRRVADHFSSARVASSLADLYASAADR
jgi:glycosyltransferase involved in cell wall biosynthesis